MTVDYVVLRPGDKNFPMSLTEIESPPQILYARGDISLLKSNCIAVVGTRRCTKYGRDAAAMLVNDCVRNGYTVVSGLAEGIDTVAHETALAQKGRTIAVMGSGFDNIYPASNFGLYKKICETGLVITEYEPATPPAKYTFPMRNRIISALSEGVIVAEAGEKSGALITAYKAIDQGKEVFAVPGSIFSDSYKGANNLIVRGHAWPVAAGEDIFRHLNKGYIPEGGMPALQLDIEQEKIFNVIRDGGGEQHIDALLSATGLKLPELNGILFNMELLGIIIKAPGNYYKIS